MSGDSQDNANQIDLNTANDDVYGDILSHKYERALSGLNPNADDSDDESVSSEEPEIGDEEDATEESHDNGKQEVMKNKLSSWDHPTFNHYLLKCAQKGNLNLVKKITGAMMRKSFDVSPMDEDGYTPLHRASYGGHTEVVEFLLSQGAHLWARTHDGWQAHHCAARWGKVETLEFLLSRALDINFQTEGGNTALLVGIDHAEVVDFLLGAGADPTITNASLRNSFDSVNSKPVKRVFEKHFPEKDFGPDGEDMKYMTPEEEAKFAREMMTP
eukprot:GFYU01002281.1.p1 GENE.GFYU01002281.1~~GFYU01002281.1.p1  ORF type:complete len:272 (-),score=36.57 GFYU01002281.1:99-914(-)